MNKRAYYLLILISLNLYTFGTTAKSRKQPSFNGENSLSGGAFTRNKSGKFHIENSSVSQELVPISGSYPLIGETWNLTIAVNENSTSGIRITMSSSYYSYHELWWEGNRNFTIEPGENRTESYISHVCTDYPAFPAFFIELLIGSKDANGTYSLILIQKGTLADIGATGQTYIWNITRWLENKSQTSSSIIRADGLMFGLIASLIILVKIHSKDRRGNSFD